MYYICTVQSPRVELISIICRWNIPALYVVGILGMVTGQRHPRWSAQTSKNVRGMPTCTEGRAWKKAAFSECALMARSLALMLTYYQSNNAGLMVTSLSTTECWESRKVSKRNCVASCRVSHRNHADMKSIKKIIHMVFNLHIIIYSSGRVDALIALTR